MTKKTIGIIYGSSTCYTDMVSEKIVTIIAQQYPGWQAQSHNIAEHDINCVLDYEYVIYGIPTWDYGELQEDWDNQWDELLTLDLHHQQAAIYGLGDQIGYPQWYQDALGYLYSQLSACGATLRGLWPVSYQGLDPLLEPLYQHQYETSQGISDDGQFFLGLPLDEENQADLTQQRLEIWLSQVLLSMD